MQFWVGANWQQVRCARLGTDRLVIANNGIKAYTHHTCSIVLNHFSVVIGLHKSISGDQHSHSQFTFTTQIQFPGKPHKSNQQSQAQGEANQRHADYRCSQFILLCGMHVFTFH